MSVASESCSIKTPGYDPSVNTEFSHSVAPRHFGAMNLLRSCVVLLALARVAAQATEPMLTLPTETATFSIDSGGSIAAISRSDNGQNYLATGQAAPVLSIRTSGKLSAPSEATWEADARRLTLRYKSAGVRVVLSVAAHPAYMVLQVVEIQPAEQVELVLWGPYPTTIGEIIGETVGVVRNREFAIGIQALNVKTLGGYPKDENDAEGESSGDDQGSYPDLPAEVLKGQHFRTDTARRTEFGSVLQAYCRNRLRDQVIPNWAHPKYRVPAFRDGGVQGSRIALFACPSERVLEHISAIEVAEGLAHPMIDGTWGKTSPGATASYLIVDFSEANVDRAIEMTRRAGLKYLYHSSPFETWGHFKLKPNLFPNGWDGLRTCVEKARLAGIRAGVHTLSNFITPNDDYVTRKPDPRLAQIGASELVSEVDAAQNEIPVLAPDYFTNKSALNTVSVGEELIRFGTHLNPGAVAFAEVRARCVGHACRSPSQRRSRGPVVGSRVQSVSRRRGSLAGNRPQSRRSVQSGRPVANLIRWLGRQLVHWLWEVRLCSFHQGLVRCAGSAIARTRDQRRQPSWTFQLAYQHPHELG